MLLKWEWLKVYLTETNFHICNYVIANMEEENLKETLAHGGHVSLPIITSVLEVSIRLGK